MSLRLLEEAEADDPILSVVNLIDVFLVIIAALLLAVANNPVNAFSQDDYTLIKNPGEANMEVLIKQGETLQHYKASARLARAKVPRPGWPIASRTAR